MEPSEISCPICNSSKHRSFNESLHRCRRCGIVYNSAYRQASYNENYFLSEYKKQYGRSYLEDFESIYMIARKRLELILSLIDRDKRKDLSLLDLGSALGFFLKGALDAGVAYVKGIEVSHYACQYCRDEFGIETINKSFQDIDDPGEFDIITAWYFLEHCQDPMAAISRIYRVLKPDGVFAMAVPSVFGPLFCFNKTEWINTHPTDHRIDFSPKTAVKVLKNAGFRDIRINAGGFHPERIIREDSMFYNPFSKIYRVISDMIPFSDTIEVYAVK